MSKTWLIGALCLSAQVAQAVPLIYNTGVDNAGVPKADNASESHFTLVGYPSPAPYVATSTGGYPIGPWIGDNTTSAWIGPSRDTFGNQFEIYVYKLGFTLTPTEATTFTLGGQWAADDGLGASDIRINGTSIGLANGSLSGGFSGWTGFNVPSGFVAGLNTLEFQLQNSGGGPTGLRVEFKHTNPVPDGGSGVALGTAGLALLLVANARRR